MINFKVIGFILGVMLIIEGFFMLLAVPISLIYNEPDWIYIFVSAFITSFSGFLLWAIFRSYDKNCRKTRGLLNCHVWLGSIFTVWSLALLHIGWYCRIYRFIFRNHFRILPPQEPRSYRVIRLNLYRTDCFSGGV
jgi:Trk-type K+ transport system membrane component